MSVVEQKHSNVLIIVILGLLMTVSPFAIDLYLPAFLRLLMISAPVPRSYPLSVASYIIGVAIGQLFYGPLLDRVGRKKAFIFRTYHLHSLLHWLHAFKNN